MSAARDQFQELGYAKFDRVVPIEQCEAAVAAIFRFLKMDSADSSTWYRPPVHAWGTINLTHDQALWDNRQHPAVHAAFAEILGAQQLWVTMDRVGFKPPHSAQHPEYNFKGFMHWDIKPEDLPIPLQVQGVLYLRDTDETMGGFHCVPGFHRVLQAWADAAPKDKCGSPPSFEKERHVPIAGKAGDLLIWDSRLPHGSGENHSTSIRLAQYISMVPASADEERRNARIQRFEQQRPKRDGAEKPHEESVFDQNLGRPVNLTPLGRKLVGFDSWE